MYESDGRGECQRSNCECGGFVNAAVQQRPTCPTENCLCGHQWWQHLMLAPNSYSNSRGGLPATECGGFYPSTPGPFNAQMICLCSRSWLSHRTLHSVPVPVTQPMASSLEPVATANNRPVVPQIAEFTSSRPPLTAFSLAVTDVASGALANREVSLQRIRANTAFSTGNRRNGGRASGQGANGQPAQRGARAGGANNHRGPNRNNHCRTDQATGRGQQRLPTSLTTTVQDNFPSSVEFLAVLLPFQVGHEDSPLYYFGLSDIEQIISTLREHKLTFILSLPCAGEVWRLVEQQISDHLHRHEISAASAPNRIASGYFTSPTFLLKPNKGRQVIRRSFIESDLTASKFTAAELRKTSQLVSNPEENAQHGLLFFAPRYRHLFGPILGQNTSHHCFPWKVWRDLQAISSTRDNREGLCTAECPKDNPIGPVLEGNPPASGSAITRVSNPDDAHLTDETVDGSQSDEVDLTIDSWRQTPSDQASPSRNTRLILAGTRPQIVNATVPLVSATLPVFTIPMASIVEVNTWQNEVYTEAERRTGLAVSGPTAEAVAETLLLLLECHRSRAQFMPPDGVTCEVSPLLSFIQRWHDIEIGLAEPQALRGLGSGPSRAVLRAGLNRLTHDLPIFGLRGNFYHPSFLQVTSPHRENLFWVAGFWSAFHLITLKLTPDPITPWIFCAAAFGKEGFPTDLDYIRALDTASAEILEPWLAFCAGGTLEVAGLQSSLARWRGDRREDILQSFSKEDNQVKSRIAN